MQWMWRKRMDDAMDVDNGYVKKRRAKKNYERIKLLFEMTGTIERARILLERGRHQELVKCEIAIRFLGGNVT